MRDGVEFMEVGGVRVEDNIVITKDGHDNLRVLPKTVEDIGGDLAADDVARRGCVAGVVVTKAAARFSKVVFASSRL